jgi:ssDNA-binding Zn-finger/Zn-ribbon topoisomerase 1
LSAKFFFCEETGLAEEAVREYIEDGLICPLCKSRLRLIRGKNGIFFGCKDYSQGCQYTADPKTAFGVVEEDAPTCPECGETMLRRRGSKGEFWGCSAYPDCTFTKDIPREGEDSPVIDEDAPECPCCGSPMRRRKWKRKGESGEFWGCSAYPECRYSRKGE